VEKQPYPFARRQTVAVPYLHGSMHISWSVGAPAESL
jgi:hypothetical protein